VQRIGVDFGATGIKGAVADLEKGAVVGTRHRISTPRPSTPERVAETIAAVVEAVDGETPCRGGIGCAVPAVVIDGVVTTAANIDPEWIGAEGRVLVSAATGRDALLLNDADAAGLAEMRYGAGRGRSGTTVVLTLGTGIGSAVFTGDRLVPNTELGHLEMWGTSAEDHASARGREDLGLDWEEWVLTRVNPYLAYLEALLWPDLIIISGGISQRPERFLPHLVSRAETVSALLMNNAGIIGAALAAAEAGR